MHAQWNAKEINQVRLRLIRIQKELVEMQYVFKPAELTGLYSVINSLDDQAYRADYAQEQQGYQDHQRTQAQSQRLKEILREWTGDDK